MNVDLLHRNRLVKRTVLGAILSVTCLSAAAVSFDCAKARSTSERLICSDPKLSALDDRLATLAAAGKRRAANPRSYQRELDAAWSERQQCQDTACVERWYARRIEALSVAPLEPDTPSTRPLPKAPPAPSAVPARPKVAAQAPAPAPAPAPPNVPDKPNVRPGAQLQVIGEELGFDIPLTREEFLDRYGGSGGQCGVSQQLPGLKALSPSVESDCWTNSECPAPAAGLSCKIVRIAYDRAGSIVLFTTTLSTDSANRTEGGRNMGKLVDKFAEFGGGEARSKDVKNGRVVSSTATQGQFKLEAEVRADENGKQLGTFSIATR